MMPALWLLFLFACSLDGRQPPASILIYAVLYDGYELANRDELVALMNVGETAVNISGWQLTDNDSGAVTFPAGSNIEPNQTVWISKNGTAVSQRYQHAADFEASDSHPLVSNLSGTWPSLSDGGDVLLLLNAEQAVVDAVVYKLADFAVAEWEGTAVMPQFQEEEGIFLQRSSQIDTNTAVDWQQVTVIVENGREIGSPRRIGQPLTPKE